MTNILTFEHRHNASDLLADLLHSLVYPTHSSISAEVDLDFELVNLTLKIL
jgi:hypothetical protein